MTEQAYCVLGVPRSGTSVTAGILHTLGVSMGSEFHPGTTWNADGQFADIELCCALSHFFSFTYPITPGHPLARPNPSEGRAQLAAYLQARHQAAGGRPWGLKDHLLPLVLAHVQELCPVPLALVVTSRPAGSSAKSWAARAQDPAHAHLRGTDTEGGAGGFLARWRSAIDAIVSHWTGPLLTVEYLTLLADPAGGVKRLADFAGVPVTAAAVALVKPGLRRF